MNLIVISLRQDHDILFRLPLVFPEYSHTWLTRMSFLNITDLRYSQAVSSCFTRDRSVRKYLRVSKLASAVTIRFGLLHHDSARAIEQDCSHFDY